MASGSYHPPPVRLVEIPKATGGTRPLGIPTVADRVAQTAVTMVLEPLVEPHFHPDPTPTVPAGLRWTRLGRRGSAAGGPTGSSIWTSKPSSILHAGTLLNKPTADRR